MANVNRVVFKDALYNELTAQAALRHCNIPSFIGVLMFEHMQRNQPVTASNATDKKELQERIISEWEEEDAPLNVGD